MVPSKSQVDFYVDLCCRLIACDPIGLTQIKDLRRDILTIRQRVSSEGLSFLTKSLPLLGKALDRGLNGSSFEIPEAFKRSSKNRSIPAFMQDYFNEVFDERGYPRLDIKFGIVKHLRQVLYLAYKLEIAYSKEDETRVISEFILTEDELRTISFDEEASHILEVASFIIKDIFTGFDPKDIIPRHGPGAVSTGEILEEKWVFSRKYSKIHEYYPYYEYFVVGGANELLDRLGWYRTLQLLDKGEAKVVLVPKDSRGPRLISCEPLEFQWVQQGLGRKLMDFLENHRLTRGHVNFTDQSINQKLAMESSLTHRYATIDMKDASDRVSILLVEKLFSRTPDLLRALMSCRSDATKLPDGSIIYLSKFAPMGSALCFPVEAICFWSIIVATMVRYFRLNQFEVRSPAEVGNEVFVYGDDIIIPTDWAQHCIPALEYFHLKVNNSKCCINGDFRESCGVDAYRGENVTPKRLKTLWSGRSTDGSAYVSYIDLANDFGDDVYGDVARWLWTVIENTYWKVPMGSSHSSYPCRRVSDPEQAERYNLSYFPYRDSRRYQRIEFLLPLVIQRKIPSKLDSWARMLRNLTMRPYDDTSTVVVPRSMSIKRGWTGV